MSSSLPCRLILSSPFLTICLLLALLNCRPLAAAEPEPRASDTEVRSVELQDVSYEGLIQEVRKLRGKIVVVDVWASYCLPCRREIPAMLQLSHRHASDGVVCLTVTVDEREARPAALAFLQQQKADCRNLFLDSDPLVWQTRWKVDNVPLVMIFDRTGQRVAKLFNEEGKRLFTYDKDVEEVVQKLLADPSQR